MEKLLAIDIIEVTRVALPRACVARDFGVTPAKGMPPRDQSHCVLIVGTDPVAEDLPYLLATSLNSNSSLSFETAAPTFPK